MAARIGWYKTLPQRSALSDPGLNLTANYDTFYNGVDANDNSPQAIFYCAVNNDLAGGSGAAVVWTTVWVPTTTDAAPPTDEPFGVGYGVLGIYPPAFSGFANGTLTITATFGGVPVPGKLVLALSNTFNGSYGSAAWSYSSGVPVVDFIGTPWEPPPSFSFGYAGDADVSLGVTPTRPGLWWFHAMGEEIRNVIAAAGLTQDLTDATQLTTAIRTLIGVAAPAPTLLGRGSGSSQAFGSGWLTIMLTFLAAGRADAQGSGGLSVAQALVGSGTASARGAGLAFAPVLAGSGVAFARGTGNFNTLSGSGVAFARGAGSFYALSGAGNALASGSAVLVP